MNNRQAFDEFIRSKGWNPDYGQHPMTGEIRYQDVNVQNFADCWEAAEKAAWANVTHISVSIPFLPDGSVIPVYEDVPTENDPLPPARCPVCRGYHDVGQSVCTNVWTADCPNGIPIPREYQCPLCGDRHPQGQRCPHGFPTEWDTISPIVP